MTTASFDAEGNLLSPATAKCCTSDITLEQFKTLKGKGAGINYVAPAMWALVAEDNGSIVPSEYAISADALRMLDVLAQDVGIEGIFSDWPATVTFYANCKGM